MKKIKVYIPSLEKEQEGYEVGLGLMTYKKNDRYKLVDINSGLLIPGEYGYTVKEVKSTLEKKKFKKIYSEIEKNRNTKLYQERCEEAKKTNDKRRNKKSHN